MSKPGPFTGRRGWVLATVAAVVLASALLDGALATTTSAPAADRFTPLVQSVMSTPRWFTGVDRRVHLVYEVQLINDFPTPVALRSVAVRNANGGRIITRLTGTKLLAPMSLLASPTELTTTVPSSGIGVVWFDVVLPNARALPPSIKHTVTVVVPPGLPGPRTVTYTGAFARVDVRPPAVIGPPLRGRGWIAIGSCCDGPTGAEPRCG